jgi:hypothetical protein
VTPGPGNLNWAPVEVPLVTLSITSIMSSSPSSTAEPIPITLKYLVSCNTKYNVLVCLNNKYRKAVEPRALSEYLFRIHKTKLKLCRQLEAYIRGFPCQYTYKTVLLLPDRSKPQPVLPVLDRLLCKHCHSILISYVWLQEYYNKVHEL